MKIVGVSTFESQHPVPETHLCPSALKFSEQLQKCTSIHSLGDVFIGACILSTKSISSYDFYGVPRNVSKLLCLTSNNEDISLYFEFRFYLMLIDFQALFIRIELKQRRF